MCVVIIFHSACGSIFLKKKRSLVQLSKTFSFKYAYIFFFYIYNLLVLIVRITYQYITILFLIVRLEETPHLPPKPCSNNVRDRPSFTGGIIAKTNHLCLECIWPWKRLRETPGSKTCVQAVDTWQMGSFLSCVSRMSSDTWAPGYSCYYSHVYSFILSLRCYTCLNSVIVNYFWSKLTYTWMSSGIFKEVRLSVKACIEVRSRHFGSTSSNFL